MKHLLPLLAFAAISLASLITQAQDLETGLAACAKLPGDQRPRCEQVMRKSSACWPLAGEARKQCLTAAGAPEVKRDPCAQAPDRARCEETIAAREACQGERGQARTECLAARQMPRPVDCTRRRGDDGGTCEIYNRALASCAGGSIADVRTCVEQRYRAPLQQVLDGFNPLDCRSPQSAVSGACALRDELLARCAESGTGKDSCTRRYTGFALQDCGRISESLRGQCAAFNAGFEFCLGKQGQELRQCTAPHNGSENASRTCTRSEGTPSFCADRDAAFGRCAERKVPPAGFGACVDSELSVSYRFQHWLLDREWVPR